MAFRQSLVHRRDNLVIRQQRIGVLHPVFAKIAHLPGNQPITEAELCSLQTSILRLKFSPSNHLLKCLPFQMGLSDETAFRHR
jgi:hypothetical protein